jgi:hypothetical protein
MKSTSGHSQVHRERQSDPETSYEAQASLEKAESGRANCLIGVSSPSFHHHNANAKNLTDAVRGREVEAEAT